MWIVMLWSKFKNRMILIQGLPKKNKATTKFKIERKVLNISSSTLTSLFLTKFCTFYLQKLLEKDLQNPSYIYPKLLYRFSKWTKWAKNRVNFLMHDFTYFLKFWSIHDFCDELKSYQSKNDVCVLWLSIVSHRKFI